MEIASNLICKDCFDVPESPHLEGGRAQVLIRDRLRTDLLKAQMIAISTLATSLDAITGLNEHKNWKLGAHFTISHGNPVENH